MSKKQKPNQVKKVVEVPKPNPNSVQVHFGNVKMIEIKLLESIVRNTGEIVKLLKDVKEEK